MKPLPTVIASSNGALGIEIVEFQGARAPSDRDAIAYYFRIRLAPDAEVSRLSVLFSGTVHAVRPDAFGLPSSGDREADFVQFALAAIGDHLDAVGLPDFTPSGVNAYVIECFSPHFQSWADRAPAPDDLIEEYVRFHLYWCWKFGHEDWQLGTPDVLRLNRAIAQFDRIIKIGRESDWTVRGQTPNAVRLLAGADLLRDERDRRKLAQPVQPEPQPFAIVETETVDAPLFVYVDESRIAELRAINSKAYDLRKLIAICEELNICYRSQCYHAVAALTRALIDHVPPILGYEKFAQVAANYAGGKSFKDTMDRLEGAARKIADAHLHQVVRRTEVLPNRTQVNFSNEVDLLLAEIIRVLHDTPAEP